MTAKRRFSKLFVGMCCCFFAACATQGNYTLEHKTVFEGYSTKGTHARALDVKNGMALTGGANGVVSFYLLNQSDNNNDIIPGVEDFRDMHYNSENACILMNSGKNGEIWVFAPGGQKIQTYDTAGVFFNGLDYWDDDQIGIVFGDPVEDKFFSLRKQQTWVEPGRR